MLQLFIELCRSKVSQGPVRVFLQELQPVMEYLEEGRFFAAQNLSEIISGRYGEGSTPSLDKGSRKLLSEINLYAAEGTQDPEVFRQIRQQYQLQRDRLSRSEGEA